MADFYMHHLFALDVSGSIKRPLDQDLVLIGAQGPDPFYFNVFEKTGASSRVLADAMHEKKIDKMLSFMITRASESNDQKLISYVIGFISHVILDQTIHPYVYHYSGLYKPKKPKVGHHRGLHMRFERRIDLEMIKHREQIAPRRKKGLSKIIPKTEIPESIQKMFKDLSSSIYDITGGGDHFTKGIRWMRFVIKTLVADRLGLKRAIFSVIDLFNRRHELFLADFSYAASTKGIDYLNLGHHPWQHPVTGETHHLSVFDLYDLAIKRFDALMETLGPCLFDGDCVHIGDAIENRSLNSGMLEGDDQTMSYFSLFMDSNLVLEKHPKKHR